MDLALPKILVLDDEEIILIALQETLKPEGYDIHTASKAKEALELLKKEEFSVVISDQRMHEMTGLEFLSEAKKIQPNASRILITGVLNLNTVIEAINTGEIYRFISKPWLREELLKTIANANDRYQLIKDNETLQKRTQQLNKELSEANQKLQDKNTELEEARELQRKNLDHTVDLVRRIISVYHPMLGAEMDTITEICAKMMCCGNFPEEDKRLLNYAATLHNLGLIGIPRETFTKARRSETLLNEVEKRIFQHHPEYGQALADYVDELQNIGSLIRSSHERWDGTGYPDSLEGESIPKLARILAIAVFFVESGLKTEEAIEEMLKESGKAFEPESVRLFIKASETKELPKRVKDILFSELSENMVLAKGIHTPTGLLIVPPNIQLTKKLLQVIKGHNLIDPITDRLLVFY